jgi:hypothetical protein
MGYTDIIELSGAGKRPADVPKISPPTLAEQPKPQVIANNSGKPSIFLTGYNEKYGWAVKDLIFELSSYSHATFRRCLTIKDK